MAKVTEIVRYNLELLGRPLPGKLRPRYIFFIAFTLFMIVESLLLLIMKRNDSKSRFLAFEDLIILFDLLAIFMDIGLFPSKSITIMDLIERKLFDCRYEFSDMQKSIRELSESITNKTTKVVIVTVIVYSACNMIMPIVISVIMISDEDFNSDNIQELPLAFENWMPIKIDSLFFYYAIVLLQTVYIVVEGLIFSSWHLLIIAAYLITEKEIQLLCESVREIDERISVTPLKRKDASDDDCDHHTHQYHNELRNYMRKIILHHQSIIK